MDTQPRKNVRKNMNMSKAAKRRRRRKRRAKGEDITRTPKALKKDLKRIFGRDPRGPLSEGSSMVAVNMNAAIPVQVEYIGSNIAGLFLAVISFASSRGWITTVTNRNYPYFAWIYMTRAMVQFTRAGTVEVSNCPRWFNLMTQAFLRKTVPYRGAAINYQFDESVDASEFWVQSMGPSVYGRGYTFGVKQVPPVLVNGKIPALEAPAPYNPDLGLNAIQDLWNFLATIQGVDQGMHSTVEANGSNCMTNDASAFGLGVRWPGGGFSTAGGYFFRINLEVPIKSPIFSVVVARSVTNVPNNRFPIHIHNFSGDSVALGGLLTMQLKEKQIHFKTPVVYKFVDFLEIGDVLARWVKNVIRNYTQTEFFRTNFQQSPSYYDEVVRCPLTLQDMLLILRGACVSVNQRDQMIGQALYPRQPSSANDNEFISFIMGQGLQPVPNANNMLLPMLLKENICSLRGRLVENGPDNTNPLMIKTVFGQFALDKLDPSDYIVQFTIDGVSYSEPVFADNTGEQPVSLIDGSYGGNLQYSAINDPSYLLPDNASWNSWIQDLGDVERTTSTLSASDGVDSLYSAFMTRYTVDQVSEKSDKEEEDVSFAIPKGKDKLTKKELLQYQKFCQTRKKQGKSPELSNTIYANRAFIAYSAGGILFQEPFQSIQSYWITPVLKTDNRSASVVDATGFYQSAQVLREPFTLIPAQGEADFPTLAALHETYSLLMVKMPFSERAEWENVIMDLSKKGQAGILGVVGSQVLRALGTTAGEVAGQFVAQAVPF